MGKKIRTLPSFNGVGAGETPTLSCPVDFTYHQLLLRYGTGTAGGPNQANIEAEITEIRLVVNGVVQRVLSAAQLFAINAFKGIPFATGMVPIFFAEPWRKEVVGQDALAWPTGDVDSFQVEVDIAPGATSPTLSAKAIVTLDQRPMGPIVKWKRYRRSPTGAGVFNLHDLPRDDAYYMIHFFHANLTDVDVDVEGADEWGLSAAEAAEVEKWNGRTQQSGVFTVDFDHTGRTNDVLRMRRPNGQRVSSFEIDLTTSAADSITVITETLGLRD